MSGHVDPYLDWKDWRDAQFGGFDAELARYYEAEIAVAAGPGVRVLEIGYGNGSFVGWCRSMGVEVLGVELSAALVARCETLLGAGKAFLGVGDERLSAAAATFTHIVALDVIEHVPQSEIPEFLARLKSLLAPAGRITLRFPNGDSPFGRIYQHADPTHVTTLGRAKLEYFAAQAGLSLAEIRAPRLPARGLGLSRAVSRVLLGAIRSCFERLIGMLYFGGRRIPLSPNYVAVLTHRAAGPSRPPGHPAASSN